MTKISKLAPKPPAPPSPPTYPVPFPVAVPGATPPPLKSQRSLFKDMFGTDHSVLALALDSHWANPEQRELALQILSGQKSISTLTDAEQEVLDAIVHSYNDADRPTGTPVQSSNERLSVPGGDEHGQDMQPTGESDLQDRSHDDGPDFSDAYSWTEGGGPK